MLRAAAATRPSTRCGAPNLGSQSITPARRDPTTGAGLVQILPVFAASSRAAVVIELTTRQVALQQGRLVTTCHTFRGFEEQDVIYFRGGRTSTSRSSHRAASRRSGGGCQPCRSSCGPKRARLGGVCRGCRFGYPSARASELLPGCKRLGRGATRVHAMVVRRGCFVFCRPAERCLVCLACARKRSVSFSLVGSAR